MNSRIVRALPGACLVVALLLFAAFHFSPPVPDQEEWGWRIWEGVWAYTDRPGSLVEEPSDAVALTSFLAFTVLIVASPFLLSVLRKSRAAWLFLTIFSGLAGLGFWAVIFTGEIDEIGDIGLGIQLLIMSNILNFIGLATARMGRCGGEFARHERLAMEE